jgi:hypothetical protein
MDTRDLDNTSAFSLPYSSTDYNAPNCSVINQTWGGAVWKGSTHQHNANAFGVIGDA